MALPEGYAISALTGKKGADGTSAKFIEIEAPNGLVFKNGSPNSLTLNAIAIGFTPSSYKWYKDGTVISGATSQTYNATTAGVYKVVCGDYSDITTVIAVSDGQDGTSPYSCSVSNENFTVATGTDLKPLSATTYSVKFQAYKGSTQLSPIAPSAAIASGKFKVSTPNASGFTVAQSTAGTLTFKTATGTAISANLTVSVTVTYDNGSTETKVITISASKTGAKGEDASQIGENLLHDSKLFGSVYGSSYPYYKYIDNGAHTANAFNGFTQTYCNNSSGTSTKDFLAWKNIKGFTLGDKYTLSFWAKGSGKFYTYWYGDSGYVQTKRIASSDGQAAGNFGDGSTTFTLTSEWKQYWVTWQLNTTGNNTVSKIILFRAYADAQVYIAGPKFEKGETATAWVPHVDEYKGETGNTGTKTFFSDYARTWTNTNWNTYKTAGYATTWNNSTVEGMRVGDILVITATLSEQGNIIGTVYTQITSVPSSKVDGYYKIGCTTLYGMVGQRGQTGATGTRGTLTFTGTEIYNIRATAVVYTLTTASTGITSTNMNILVGDRYINSLTGDVWKCTTAGTASTAKWTYEGRQAKDSDSSNQFRFFGEGTKTKYNTGGTNISQTEVTGEGPFGGNTSLLKITRPANAASNGRVTPYSKTIKLEAGVSYRYACYAKKTNDGFINYFGCRGWEQVSETVKNSQILALNGSEINSGYFVSSKNFGTVGRWYLVIGYVTANGVTTAPANDAGVYDMVTKQRVANCINYQFKNITEFTHNGTLIEYTESSSTPTVENTTYIYDIRFDKMDGTQPTLNELLNLDSEAKGKGTWASGTNYIIGDIVFYSTNGCSYICKSSHTSSSSIVPTNTTYWDKIADKGEKGDRGFSSRTIAFRVNYSAFSTANDGEVYVCGYNANGAEADTYGYVIINGTTYYAKGMLNSNCAMNGYMAIQKSGATSSGSPATPVYVFEDGSNTWYQVANGLTTVVKSAISSKADWIVLAKVHSQTGEGKVSLEPMTPCLLSDINSVIEMKYEGIVAAVTNYTSAQITPYKITGSNGSFSKTALTARYVERGALVLNTNAVTPTSSTAQARMMLFDGTTWTEISSSDARYNDAILLCAGALPSLAGYYYTLGLATPNICGTYIDTLTTNRAFINEAMINLIRAYDINFKNSVSSYKDSGYVAGDLAISMGKNPKNTSDTENNFIIQSYKGDVVKSGNSVPIWKKEFFTKKTDNGLIDLFINGKLNLAGDLEISSPSLYVGVEAEPVCKCSGSGTAVSNYNCAQVFYNDKIYLFQSSTSSTVMVSVCNYKGSNTPSFTQLAEISSKGLVYDATVYKNNIYVSFSTGVYRFNVSNNSFTTITTTYKPVIMNIVNNLLNLTTDNNIFAFYNGSSVITKTSNGNCLWLCNFTQDLLVACNGSLSPSGTAYATNSLSFYNPDFTELGNQQITGKTVTKIDGTTTTISSACGLFAYNGVLITCALNLGIVISYDCGQTWKQVFSRTILSFKGYATQNIIILHNDAEVIYSLDNGVNWNDFNLRYNSTYRMGKAFLAQTTLYKDILVPVGFDNRLSFCRIRQRNIVEQTAISIIASSIKDINRPFGLSMYDASIELIKFDKTYNVGDIIYNGANTIGNFYKCIQSSKADKLFDPAYWQNDIGDSGYIVFSNGLKIQWIRTTHTNSTKSLAFDLSFSNKNYFVFCQSERTDNGYPNTFVGGVYNKQNDNRTFTYATSYNSQSESVTNDIFFAIGY